MQVRTYFPTQATKQDYTKEILYIIRDRGRLAEQTTECAHYSSRTASIGKSSSPPTESQSIYGHIENWHAYFRANLTIE